jgi:hypothetical protein
MSWEGISIRCGVEGGVGSCQGKAVKKTAYGWLLISADTPKDIASRDLLKQNCHYEALRPILEAGATIEHVYQLWNGSRLGIVTIKRHLCGF